MPLTFRILSEVKSAQQLLSLNLHCSEDTRARACAAHHFQPLTQKEIAKQYSVSQSTISRWLKQSFDCSLWGPYRRRRNRILDSSEVTTLLSIVDVDPQLFLHQMKKIALKLFGETMSETTLYRILKDANYSHKLSQKILSKCKQSLTKSFSDQFSSIVGPVNHSQLLFIDELSFVQKHFHQRWVWSPVGKPVSINLPKVAVPQISVVGAINKFGYVCGHNPIEAFFGLLRRRVRTDSSRFPEAPATQIILSALESLRSYDCSSLFEHAGWTNGQFYHSPYLNNSKLANCIEMDIENDRTE
ncbi:hypothetical protein P9112_005114 [Eukaryota sp. TZLM1-RC]